NPTKYLSLLDCFHTGEFTPPPVDGDTVYCVKCGDYRIVAVATTEWRIKCSGCTLGRAFGAAEDEARALAGKHADSHKHAVKLYRGGAQVELIQAEGAPLTGITGWVQEHPEHGASLRTSARDAVTPSGDSGTNVIG